MNPLETELGSPDIGAFNLNQADFQVWRPKAAEPCVGAYGNEQTRDTLKELLLLLQGRGFVSQLHRNDGENTCIFHISSEDTNQKYFLNGKEQKAFRKAFRYLFEVF